MLGRRWYLVLQAVLTARFPQSKLMFSDPYVISFTWPQAPALDGRPVFPDGAAFGLSFTDVERLARTLPTDAFSHLVPPTIHHRAVADVLRNEFTGLGLDKLTYKLTNDPDQAVVFFSELAARKEGD